MRTIHGIIGMLLLSLLVAGCSVPRPVARMGCDYAATPLRVSPLDPHPLFGAAASPMLEASQAGSFGDALGQAINRQPIGPGELSSSSQVDYLVLSGGSQHGAFGAGLLYGLEQAGPVPTYKIVTGVSTGALQSTFVFLANQPTGGGDYSWVNGPLAGTIEPGKTNLGDLALAYSIASESNIIKVRGDGAILGALKHGSTATFDPLRARLQALITPKLMREIAEQHDVGRSLFVAVSDVDDGIGYAIDLTALADRIKSPTQDFAQLQGCYIDALLASSSVPSGVPPASLELHRAKAAPADMFIDGGARDGVFIEQVLAGIKARATGAKVTVIVNGVLYQAPWQSKGQRVDKWSVVSLALRSVDMLETQVYRFSVARAEEFGATNGGLQMAFISTQNLAPGAEESDDHQFRGKSCRSWSDIDSAAGAAQFHPNYMSCLVDYGIGRGKGEEGGTWNRDISRAVLVRAAP